MNPTSDAMIAYSALSLLDTLHSPVWIFDIERTQMWWANRAALSLWKAESVEELINRNWSNISQGTRTRLENYIPQFKQGKTVVEQWTFYPQGNAVLVQCTCSGVKIESNRLAMLVEGVIEGVECSNSENLRSIEALRHASVMISLYTLDGAVVMQNPAAIRCYGNNENNAFETASNIFAKRFVDATVAERAMACISESEIFSTAAQIITLNGIRWHEIDMRRINDPATGEQLILSSETDITQPKQVEEQLQQSATQLQQSLTFEAMLKRITDKVRDGLDQSQILQTVVQELVLVLGASCCNTALYDLERGISTICYEYATLNPKAQSRVSNIANFPEVYQQLLQGEYCQFCSITPNPLRGRVAMLACPFVDDQRVLGDLWLINHHEHAFNELEIRLVQQVANQCAIAIRQARLYQAATSQVEELRKLGQLKDDFLSTVSHELRTPVSNMKMAIRMLLFALNQETPQLENSKAARYLNILQNECDREIDLIDDLLALQSLEAGDQSMVLETIQLQNWLPRIVEPFYERVKHHQQTLQVELSPNLPPLISNPASLERIVAELLNNACKYTPLGEKIVVTADVSPINSVHTSQTNQNELRSQVIRIAVSNSGVEIPASELPRIFEKFYRIPSTDPWKQGGTGLGLALVQSITRHLGGTIQVSSNAGQTVFTVELPIQPH